MTQFLNGTDPGLRQTRTPTVDTYTAGAQFTAGSSTQVSLSSDPGTENNVIITFDGITQHRDTYAVSGTTVTFDAAIATGVSKVEATYTTTIPAHEPADGSVTVGKLSTTGSPSASTFLRGDMAWAAPSGGLVVQVIESTIAKTSTTTTIPTDDTAPVVTEGVELDSQAITLADSSNKCLITGHVVMGCDTAAEGGVFALFRGSTCLFVAEIDSTTSTTQSGYAVINYLDSPSTASEITYSLRYGATGGSATVRINFGTNSDDAAGLKTSKLIFTEISA